MESHDKSATPNESDLRILHNDIPRAFNTFPGSSYLLPSDERERDRLTNQHKMVTSALGGKLVLAPMDLEGSHFVLDSGTGPGTWLLELAAKMPPSAVLHGIDIETKFVPDLRPMNVSFSRASITNLPREWSSRFDMVNQRLLIAALTSAEWESAMAEMHRVLQPGGWIQLVETSNAHGGAMTIRGLDIVRALHRAHGICEPPEIESYASRILQEKGFQKVMIQRCDIPLGRWAGQRGIDARYNYTEMFVAFKTAVLRAGGLGIVKSEEEYDEFIEALATEWDQTTDAKMIFSIITAQKPAEKLRMHSNL